MEPSNKKRRLAPKVADQPSNDQTYDKYQSNGPLSDNATPPERNTFEAFARHLQDAAVLIYSQATRCQYSSVSVLLMRWADDMAAEPDLRALETMLRERYNFQTQVYGISSGINAAEKLIPDLRQTLEFAARPDHLWIVYYGGRGFLGNDTKLYWSYTTREGSSRIQWDSIKDVIDEVQSDVLLLLDTISPPEVIVTGQYGSKQTIAAYTPDQVSREVGPQSFTRNLIDALARLCSGRPFTVQRLHEETMAMQHMKAMQEPLVNGTSDASMAALRRTPVCYFMTPGNQTISISPVGAQPPADPQISSPMGSPISNVHSVNHITELVKANLDPGLTFEKTRALVCTTFLSQPSAEMADFKEWLATMPAAYSKITVEGIFQGPPTVLFLTIPIAIWDILSADRTCGFLGYVNSHNLTTEYQRLLGGMASLSKAATNKELEDGKILLEARQAAASTPVMHRHDIIHAEVIHQDSMRQDSLDLLRQEAMGLGSIYPEPPALPGHKDEVEDSVEMHEAAEQLKALSHVRHVSHDRAHSERNHSHIASEGSPGLRSAREESASSPDNLDSAAEDPIYNAEYNSAAVRTKHPRRSVPKSGPKQDTQCTHCEHAPFKDASSLKKHVSAAHTRPFPCAFSFAGCTSNFGSKNEWKRHIASQHLCLTIYRCSSCPQSTVEGKGNEFNRKDLFTQHLRRMHAPFAIKKGISKASDKLLIEWEAHVKEMQASCLVQRRQPPQRSACPKPGCSNVFEGAGSWDDWTEHVGRHMEKGEADCLGVDNFLARWALEQGIIERRDDGEYRLIGSEKDVSGTGYYSDGNGNLAPRSNKPGNNMSFNG